MLGYGARASTKALGQAVGDRVGGPIAVERVTRPGVEVDDDRFAVSPDDGVAAEYLEPQRRGGAERSLAKARDLERMTDHSLVAMIEPFEPI